MTNTKTKNTIHQPVLLESVVELLDPKQGESYLDVTAGYGGHASEIARKLGDKGSIQLVDRDQTAVDHLSDLFKHDKRTSILHTGFAEAVERLVSEQKRFDIVLADFGISSLHIDTASRGFSFAKDGPLDMRMDQSQVITAAHIVNTKTVDEIARIIKQYGEEPRATEIAKAIVRRRPFNTTLELAELIEEITPRRGYTHPATRTFQALRIAVNAELEQISHFLAKLPQLLNDGGRVAVISFHSLEDRLVKQAFQGLSRHNGWELLTKKPIRGDESDFNPRARSAKLRACRKK